MCHDVVKNLQGARMGKILFAVLAFFVGTTLMPLQADASAPKYRFDVVTQKARELRFPSLWAGYQTFENVCKSCHFTGNDKGAPFLHTESRSMRAWNRVFYEKYTKCANDGSWAGLSQDDLVNLNDYLYSNARDADNPFCST